MTTDKLIQLNEDDKEVCLKMLNNTFLAVKSLHHLISNDKLTEETIETIPQFLEFRIAEVSKIIGFDSLSARKVEEKHAEIRKANQTIRELEGKIASNQPIEGLKEQLESLASLFQKWWRLDGFRYVEDMAFTQYGSFEAVLGISFHHSSVFSKKPASERQSKKEWLESLKKQGYQIYENESGGDKELIDCPENEELLTKLIEGRFPSAIIEEWKKRRILNADGHVYEIERIKVCISDLKELIALEVHLGEKEEEF